jgi:hypothetical protein
MAGFLVKGRAWNSHDFMDWRVCCLNSAVISDSLLREKTLNIATGFGIKDFAVSEGQIHCSCQLRDVVYKLRVQKCRLANSGETVAENH